MPITLLITDDHQLLRETWRWVLNTDKRFHVLATCSSGEEAIATTKKLQPDIVIMDINLPGINGIEATRLIVEQNPNCKVLGYSLNNQAVYAQKIIAAGAMGYVTKTASLEEMIAALLNIASNRKYVCGEMAKKILASL
jgi:two-component system invasion response regulator UvrY